MKIYIVEDSRPICERLVQMLAAMDRVEVVGQAETPADAVDGILRSRPDWVVLDIKLSGGSGIDVLRQVHARAPETGVIMLTNHDTPQYRRACLAAGARHFFDKSSEFDKIKQVLRECAENRPAEQGQAQAL